jgi:hypothetical protein
MMSELNSPQPKIMSRRDFASKLRTELPDLKQFSDDEIVNQVLQLRPDLLDKVENPMAGDAQAAMAQQRAQDKSSFWGQHPNIKQGVKIGLDTLPGLGAIGGGLLATPETFGGGTVIGGALGAGAGRGLRDIATQFLGMENTTPLQKGVNIGVDTAITGLTPGVVNAIRAPISSARLGARSFLNLKNAATPEGLQRYTTPPFLKKFAAPEQLPPSDVPYIQGSPAINVGSKTSSIKINPQSEINWRETFAEPYQPQPEPYMGPDKTPTTVLDMRPQPTTNWLGYQDVAQPEGIDWARIRALFNTLSKK